MGVSGWTKFLVGVTYAEDEGTCVSPRRVRLEVEVAKGVSDCCTFSSDVSHGSSALKGVSGCRTSWIGRSAAYVDMNSSAFIVSHLQKNVILRNKINIIDNTVGPTYIRQKYYHYSGPFRGKNVLVRDLFWAPYTLQLIESFFIFSILWLENYMLPLFFHIIITYHCN